MAEPTTHLDIGSIDSLIGALEQFEGTVIFITHDVHFIRALAKNVLHISAGQLTPYAGDYDYYLDKSGATSARAALTSGAKLANLQPPSPEAPRADFSGAGRRDQREQRRAEAEERKPAAKAQRERQMKVEQLEMRI